MVIQWFDYTIVVDEAFRSLVINVRGTRLDLGFRVVRLGIDGLVIRLGFVTLNGLVGNKNGRLILTASNDGFTFVSTTFDLIERLDLFNSLEFKLFASELFSG